MTDLTNILTMIVGLIGGGFAFGKVIVNANRQEKKEFLEFLTVKNGHLERIANKFSDTTLELTKSVDQNTEVTHKLSDSIDRLNRHK